VLNEVLTAFDHVDDVAGRSAITAQGAGVSGYHKLALRLSRAGLVSCEVDAAWASQQSAQALVAAFDEALARAKADLAAQVAADPERKLDQVLSEALGLLNDPQRLAES
jgi:urocanate hydratase